MATTSDAAGKGSPRRLRRLLGPVASALGSLFMPPLCLHCEGPRWRGTPLCLACLRRLDALPAAEGAACARCGAESCGEDHGYWPHAFSGARFLYRVTPELSTVVHGFKYRHMRRNAAFLCARLRRRPDLADYIRSFDALVPVPLHSARLRERGYNQAALIAGRFGAAAGVPVLSKALKRTRSTGTQTLLGRDGRLRNLDGAFACPDPIKVRDRRILLVDDVYTTGATVGACATVLRSAGAADVGVIALGRVEAGAPEDDFVAEMEAMAAYLA